MTNQMVELSPRDEAAKRDATIAYILMGIGMFTGIFWVVGAIWAWLKRSDASGTLFADHFQKLVSLFIWTIVLSIIGGVLIFFGIGIIILWGVWLWAVYRLVNGFIRLNRNQPYGN